MDSRRFDASRARKSLEESLKALNLDRVHLLHLHDPEYAADLDAVTCTDGALALQFSIHDPRVTSTICCVSKAERVRRTLDWANWPIQDEVWKEFEALPYSTGDPESTRVYQPD